MAHAAEKRRTGMSALRAPLRRDRERRDLMITMAVGFTMIVILGMYAVSFRGMLAAARTTEDAFPQWEAVSQEIFGGVRPTIEGLSDIRSSLSAVVEAKATQAESIDILKAKLESASATPETPTP